MCVKEVIVMLELKGVVSESISQSNQNYFDNSRHFLRQNFSCFSFLIVRIATFLLYDCKVNVFGFVTDIIMISF